MGFVPEGPDTILLETVLIFDRLPHVFHALQFCAELNRAGINMAIFVISSKLM